MKTDPNNPQYISSEKDDGVSSEFLKNEKVNPFSVPEDYFDTLPIHINHRIHAHASAHFSFTNPKLAVRWIMVVLAFALISSVLILFVNQNPKDSYLAQNNLFPNDTNRKHVKVNDSLSKYTRHDGAVLPKIEKYDLNKTLNENNISESDVNEYLDDENILDNIYEL